MKGFKIDYAAAGIELNFIDPRNYTFEEQEAFIPSHGNLNLFSYDELLMGLAAALQREGEHQGRQVSRYLGIMASRRNTPSQKLMAKLLRGELPY